jgi:hypothetical protein
MRQALKRYQRKGLSYSKDLETHKLAVEEKPWILEQVVEMTADYMRRKEDAEFEKAFALMA